MSYVVTSHDLLRSRDPRVANLPPVRVRYLSGDDLMVVHDPRANVWCRTVMDVKVYVAKKNDRFAPEIAVLTDEYVELVNDDECVPTNVVVLVYSVEFDKKMWARAIKYHAFSNDLPGVQHAFACLSRIRIRNAEIMMRDDAEAGQIRRAYMVNLCPFRFAGELLLEHVKMGHNGWRKREKSEFGIKNGDDSKKHDADADADEEEEWERNMNFCKCLMTAGADVGITDVRGWNSLLWASRHGLRDLVKLLLKAQSDVNYRTPPPGGGETSLFTAALCGHAQVLELLLEHNALVNMEKENGETSIFYACRNGQISTVERLIAWNADINHRDTDGQTCLFYSAINGHLEVVERLIYMKIDVTDSGRSGFTALYWARKFDYVEIEDLLMYGRRKEEKVDEKGRIKERCVYSIYNHTV